jgi:cytochrome d ubiquinol oxidase subunit I
VAITFFAFRIMVGIGLIMLAVVLIGNAMRHGGRLYENRTFLRICEFVAPLGFLAVVAGWTTTEVGRQPWTVYGLLRTADSVSPSLTGGDVALTLAGYMLAYLIMFPAGILLMARIVRRGPDAKPVEGPVESGRPEGPIHALPPSGEEDQ